MKGYQSKIDDKSSASEANASVFKILEKITILYMSDFTATIKNCLHFKRSLIQNSYY